MTRTGTALRRRDPGGRLRIYLDQSTLGDLVGNPAYRSLLDLLRDSVAAGLLICPASGEHRDETAIAPPALYPRLSTISQELSMGVSFHEADYIETVEVSVAAAAFLGEPRKEPMWREAFRKNPETARPFLRGSDDYRPGFGIASGLLQEEVANEKSKAAPISEAYAVARAFGHSFEEQVEREFEEMIYWRLGSLADPRRFARQKSARAQNVMRELGTGNVDPISPGNALSKYSALYIRHARANSLLRRYPALEGRVDEFVKSQELRVMPALRYPALLHAAAATTRGRKFRPNDLYDFGHLTKGLGRCDFVTADSGMAQLCRNFDLIPEGCELFGARELAGFEARLRERLALS